MVAQPGKTPRRAPRQGRSKATFDAVLDAAAQILSHEGYEQMTTNRIAVRAGTSVGSLYQYFPNKESLVIALRDRHAEKMIEAFETIVASLMEAPLANAVPAIAQAMLASHNIDPELHANLNILVSHLGGGRRLVDKVEARAVVVTRAYLEARRDEIRPANVERASFILVHTVYALAQQAAHHPQYRSNPAFVNDVADLVLRFLTKDPAVT